MPNKNDQVIIINAFITSTEHNKDNYVSARRAEETLRGRHGFDFELANNVFDDPMLPKCLDIILMCNLGTQYEDKSMICRLLYG